MTKLPPAELASYEFNIRSFHPEKTFGWSGLFFEGDNRGFSLRPSGRNFPTSRVWQRFLLNTEPGSVSALVTRSDPSKAPWSGQSQYYSDEALLPSERVALEARKLPGSISQLRISGSYGGVNHAMYGSARSLARKKLSIVSQTGMLDSFLLIRAVDIVWAWSSRILRVCSAWSACCEFALNDAYETDPCRTGHITLTNCMQPKCRQYGKGS